MNSHNYLASVIQILDTFIGWISRNPSFNLKYTMKKTLNNCMGLLNITVGFCAHMYLQLAINVFSEQLRPGGTGIGQTYSKKQVREVEKLKCMHVGPI